MKKIILSLCVCIAIFGCSAKKKQLFQQEELNWEGQYQSENVTLNVSYDEDYPDGIIFEFKNDEEIFENYARFDTDDLIHAVFDVEESGHILTFSLRYDRIIVKETDGITFEDIALTGQYIKK